MPNNDYKHHITIVERDKWDKVVADFAAHLGSGGTTNHRLGNGSIPGFSTNDYTNTEKNKLASVDWYANNYTHPATHPYTMITGLGKVAHSNLYSDLDGIPETFKAGGGNADTVGGIRITVGSSSPSGPTNYKDVWFDTTNKLVKVYYNSTWNSFTAVWG